jgi:hypothetical protein
MSIDKLDPSEIKTIQTALKGLITSLRARKPAGGPSGLIPDEEYVLESLVHPERGDILITAMRGASALEVFVANRRDAASPFVLMDFQGARKNPGRRQLNHNPGGLKEGEWGLFLNSIQDRELLRTASCIEVYSTHFGIGDSPSQKSSITDRIESKSVESMSTSEKFQLFKRGLEGEVLGEKIDRDLFGFQVQYAKHKMQPRQENIILNPKKVKQAIGQVVRDIYPYGIRVILRKEYPAEHKQKLAEVHKALHELASLVKQKAANSSGEGEYAEYLEDIASYIEKIPAEDAELAQFV